MAINPGLTDIQNNHRYLLVAFDKMRGLEQGMRKSAIDQYAGKCHFIYELLQNAGDAGATEVEFTLTREALEFRHNGSRQFDLADVDSITNYHDSTKGEDYEAVGKFGMGFKSVFEFTNTPEIHSGDYHFRIERMFYPETEGVRTDEPLNGWTKFIIPFGQSGKTTEEIFEKVRQGLSQIHGDTLLFLRRIRKIECLFENGTYLSIVREENAEHIVRIKRVSDAGKTSCAYYLKFSKTVQLSDDARKLDIAIAYGLENDPAYLMSGDMEGLSPRRFTIRPLRGKVFVYFPAEKELSNLQFHINAPFATPMSRESLTENRDNEKLLRELAKLTVESLPFLRDHGLLKTETLAVFPIDKDQLPPKYSVFETDIVNAFNTQDLTPTRSGLFKRADRLIRSENRMSDLFTDEDMAKIYRRYQVPVWVKAPMVHTREDDFLSALDLNTFGNDDLAALVNQVTVYDKGNAESFYGLIRGFDDKRLLELYRKVADINFDSYQVHIGPIFREKDGGMFCADEMYFDVGVADEMCEDLFLKRIYKDTDSKLISFFKKHGVREYSTLNILKSKCLDLKKGICKSEALAEYKTCVKLYIQAYRENAKVTSELKDFPWLWDNLNGVSFLAGAESILMDQPYEETGMRFLAKVFSEKHLISRWYAREFDVESLGILIKVMGAYPFIREIRERYIEERWFSTYGHPRHSELALPPGCRQRDPWYRDCTIDQIDELVKRIDDNISCRLWKLLTSLRDGEAGRNPFKAICHHSASCTKEADSLLVCSLQSKAWVKGIDERWHRPMDISFSTLHQMYKHRTMCEGLRVVRFGMKAEQLEKANIEKRREVDNFVKSVGARNAEEIREAIDMMHRAQKCGIDVKGQILKKETSVLMPESPSGNVERRQQRAGEDFKSAENQTREVRERSVRVSNSREQEARVRLERDYTDDSKQMRCQLCRMPMPFKKRDGQPYFECVQIFRDMSKETPDQYLALCPNCRAAYDEWVRKLEANRDRLKEEILSKAVSNGQGSVTVMLPNYGTPACKVPPTNDMALYFVASHFIDLQVVLRNEE